MKTTEENRLIAEFMGYEFKLVKNPTIDVDGVSHIKDEATVIDGKLYFDNNLRYQSSWDWLMPVLKKIDESEVELNEDSNLIGDITHGLVSIDIQMAIHAEIEFIKWYK